MVIWLTLSVEFVKLLEARKRRAGRFVEHAGLIGSSQVAKTG
jgi:hypothetical protein